MSQVIPSSVDFTILPEIPTAVNILLPNPTPKRVFKVADSQVASRWGNILEFKNFDLITPNEREARFSLGDQDSPIGSLSDSLAKSAKSKYLTEKD